MRALWISLALPVAIIAAACSGSGTDGTPDTEATVETAVRETVVQATIAAAARATLAAPIVTSEPRQAEATPTLPGGNVSATASPEPRPPTPTSTPLIRPPTPTQLQQTKAAWTLMVYMMADEDLEPFALEDLKEMASVGSTDDVNIIVEIDRHPGYDNGGVLNLPNWTTTKRLRVEPGFLREIEDLGERDGGNPDTLRSFLEWGITTYPAETYGLVFWDHGSSWPGFGVDETNGESKLTISEISDVLGSLNVHLGLMGFDACLMGSWEVASALHPYTSALVVSPALEPGDGWDYAGIVRRLVGEPAMPPMTLGRAIVDTYAVWYGANRPGITDIITLAVIDTSVIPALDAQVVQLMDAIERELDAIDNIGDQAIELGHLELARSRSQVYGRSSPQAEGEYFDLGQFLEQIRQGGFGPIITEAAGTALATLRDTVVRRHWGVDRADSSGLSIWFPQSEDTYSDKIDDYLEVPSVAANEWGQFLGLFQGKADIDTVPPTILIDIDRDVLTPGVDVARISALIEDDFYVAEIEVGLLWVEDDLALVVFWESVPSDFDPSVELEFELDGTAVAVTGGAADPQLVAPIPLGESALGLSGTYVSGTVPEGVSVVVHFDSDTGDVVVIYAFEEGSAAEVAIEPGARFVPSLLIIDVETDEIIVADGDPIPVDLMRLSVTDLPAGEYDLVIVASDFGDNLEIISIPLTIGLPGEVQPPAPTYTPTPVPTTVASAQGETLGRPLSGVSVFHGAVNLDGAAAPSGTVVNVALEDGTVVGTGTTGTGALVADQYRIDIQAMTGLEGETVNINVAGTEQAMQASAVFNTNRVRTVNVTATTLPTPTPT